MSPNLITREHVFLKQEHKRKGIISLWAKHAVGISDSSTHGMTSQDTALDDMTS